MRNIYRFCPIRVYFPTSSATTIPGPLAAGTLGLEGGGGGGGKGVRGGGRGGGMAVEGGGGRGWEGERNVRSPHTHTLTHARPCLRRAGEALGGPFTSLLRPFFGLMLMTSCNTLALIGRREKFPTVGGVKFCHWLAAIGGAAATRLCDWRRCVTQGRIPRLIERGSNLSGANRERAFLKNTTTRIVRHAFNGSHWQTESRRPAYTAAE